MTSSPVAGRSIITNNSLKDPGPFLQNFWGLFCCPIHSCLTSSLPHCKKALYISDPVFIAVEILFDKLAMNLVTYTQHQPTPLSVGDDNSKSQIFKTGDQEKNEFLEGLKESLPWIFAWGAYYVSCQNKVSTQADTILQKPFNRRAY